jgi:hypothetical protein
LFYASLESGCQLGIATPQDHELPFSTNSWIDADPRLRQRLLEDVVRNPHPLAEADLDRRADATATSDSSGPWTLQQLLPAG